MKDQAEYSKNRLDKFIVLWFYGAAFGAFVVLSELVAQIVLVIVLIMTGSDYVSSITIHLPDLLLYIGGPVTGGIITYLVKSALENKEKIKKSDRVMDIPNANPDEP